MSGSARLWTADPQAITGDASGGNPFPLAWTALRFSGFRWDTGGHWSASLPTRLTLPTAGHRTVGGAIQVSGGGNGLLYLGLRLNGATWICARDICTGPWTPVQAGLTVDTDWLFAAGDYVELLASGYAGFNGVSILAVEAYSAELWSVVADSP